MSRPRARGILFSLLAIVGVCLTADVYPVQLEAETIRGNVICNDEVSNTRRVELEQKLQKITGWPDLSFARENILHIGKQQPSGGSSSARELITKALSGQNVVVIEDASQRLDVVFCQVVESRETANATGGQIHVVLIDFTDFEHVMGDARALDAFNVGWAFLHELDHVVNNSGDASAAQDVGECETHINKMRQECELPVRAGYFHTPVPLINGTSSLVRLVRLGFVEQSRTGNKKRQYWLVWDANLVGTGDKPRQIG